MNTCLVLVALQLRGMDERRSVQQPADLRGHVGDPDRAAAAAQAVVVVEHLAEPGLDPGLGSGAPNEGLR